MWGHLAVLGDSDLDARRGAPDGWIKADRLHPLIPRELERSGKLYRSRGAVEREFGRLKLQWVPLANCSDVQVRAGLHADLTIVAKLACALSRARGLRRLTCFVWFS
jgi:hypothetical protein